MEDVEKDVLEKTVMTFVHMPKIAQEIVIFLYCYCEQKMFNGSYTKLAKNMSSTTSKVHEIANGCKFLMEIGVVDLSKIGTREWSVALNEDWAVKVSELY